MEKTKNTDDSIKKVNVYNTVDQQYQDVEVRVEVYAAYRRTQWNMDKNDAKHAYHTILYSDMICPRGQSVEEFDEFASDKYNPEEILIEKESDLLGNAIKVLDQCATQTQKRRFILHYYEGLSARHIAMLEGVHHSVVCDCLKAVSKNIKEYLKNFPK
ncbi:MAG: hypothetical protein ACYC5K_10715 [Saccharofermentanales bacterium]